MRKTVPETRKDYRNAVTIEASWEEFHQDARRLVPLLKPLALKGLLAITRGGLIPAAILARDLDIRLVDTLCIASYDGKLQGGTEVLKGAGIANIGDGTGYAIVDDLVDSGKTAKVARALLPGAKLAAVYAKPQGKPFADFSAVDIDQNVWMIFPWDR